MKTYLQEFPNPQFERTNWQNLNGMWDFGFNKAERGFKFSADEKIAVQLCSSNQ